MSNKALNWAFALPLRGAEKSVLVALANRANEALEAWPSQADLALCSGVSERSVRAALDGLEARGLIEADRQHGRLSHYVMHTEITELTSGFKPEPTSDLSKPEPEATSGKTGTYEAANRNLVPFKPEATSDKPSRTKKENPQEPSTRAREAEPEGFADWWAAYPRKVGRGQALRAYRTALKATDPGTLLTAVLAYPFDRDRPQFIPHGSTWLNGQRWLDQIDTRDPVLAIFGLVEPEPSWPIIPAARLLQ